MYCCTVWSCIRRYEWFRAKTNWFKPTPTVVFLLNVPRLFPLLQFLRFFKNPISILHKSIAERYRPVSYPDGPITTRCRFIRMLAGNALPQNWLLRCVVFIRQRQSETNIYYQQKLTMGHPERWGLLQKGSSTVKITLLITAYTADILPLHRIPWFLTENILANAKFMTLIKFANLWLLLLSVYCPKYLPSVIPKVVFFISDSQCQKCLPSVVRL